jgi:TetR/AcrR family transcriptional regulator
MTSSARVPRRVPTRPSAPEPSARDRLLEAAVEMFERKGYAATSVREIVEHAGLTKPALYYYFRSKEGILIAALELAVGELDRLLSDVAHASGSARSRLAGLCARALVASRSRSSLVRVAHAVAFGPREAIPPFDFIVFERLVREHLRRIVADGVATGEIRRAAAGGTIYAMQALLMLAIGQHVEPRREALEPKDMRRLVDLVLDGAGVTPRLGKGASS